MWICKVIISTVVFSVSWAGDGIGGVRSQGSSRIAMELCMAEIDYIMENEKV